MTETNMVKQLRDELTTWIDGHIGDITANINQDLTMPGAVDFILFIATEDLVDPESDTWYATVSSGTSHYRKVGLAKTLMRTLLRTDDEDED